MLRMKSLPLWRTGWLTTQDALSWVDCAAVSIQAVNRSLRLHGRWRRKRGKACCARQTRQLRRRKCRVEQERRIKENELNTEVASKRRNVLSERPKYQPTWRWKRRTASARARQTGQIKLEEERKRLYLPALKTHGLRPTPRLCAGASLEPLKAWMPRCCRRFQSSRLTAQDGIVGVERNSPNAGKIGN